MYERSLSKMGAFQDLSIRWKLKLIIMLTSGAALLFASGTLMYRNIVESRKIIRNDLSSLAKVIGMNSVGAIVFYDQQTAENNLAALHAKPYVVLACIYDRHGQVFAEYIHENADPKVLVAPMREPGHYYEDNYLLVFNPVLFNKEVIGTVCIQFDLKGTQRESLESAGIFGIILLIAFLIIWILSVSLQKVISRPILRLTQIARMVIDRKDFSVRAEKYSKDEIGVLIDAFNDMLAGIQSRDDKLQEYREHLEEQVANRTLELSQANAMLKTAKDAAESANRAKSEFLANMSHEIRTPMNAVLGFADLLKSLVTDSRQKSYLDAISSSGEGLLTLINGILDLSKIEAGKMELQNEPVKLHAVLDEIRYIFALQASEKKIEFGVSLDPDIPQCLILDEVRLKQILFNLIGNAVKFTSKGFVRTTVKHHASSRHAESIDLLITVEDSGIGIPQQYQSAIFEAFRQKEGQSTKRFGGTGLGLSITKRLVEMMGGTISVDSAENSGSRFCITIPDVPVTKEDIEADRDGAFGSEEVEFLEATVLIADDVSTNRLLIKELLRLTPISTIEAKNGEEAVLLSRDFKPDAVLMDLRMPVLNGRDAMYQIRKDDSTRSIPIIALTASGMKGEKERMIEMGFSGYLTKPLKKEELFRELSIYLPHAGGLNDVSEVGEIESEELEPTRALVVLAELEETWLSRWKDVRKNLFFDEIGAFAQHIATLGDKHAVEILKAYGKELGEYVDSFDVERMKNSLNVFPEIVDSIRSQSVQTDKEENHDR